VSLAKELRRAARAALVSWVLGRLSRAASEIAHRDELHMNPPSVLPPVDCPLLIRATGTLVYPHGEEIEIVDKLLRVSRPSFVERRGDDIEYRTPVGASIFGRFPWTYP